MGIGSARVFAVAVVQLLVAVGLFVGVWLGLIRLGEALLGYSSPSSRSTSSVLELAGASIAAIAMVHLPFAIAAARRTIAASRQSGKSEAFIGSEGHLLGAITRWRLRVGVVMAFFAVTLALSLVVLLTGVDFAAIFRMVAALGKDSGERHRVVQAQGQLIFQGLKGAAFGWALLSGAVLWVAAKVRSGFEVAALPVARYHYHERSDRLLRSVVVGVRRGLNATALSVIALPALLIDYDLALHIGFFGDWSKDSPLDIPCGWLDRLASIIAVNPVGAAMLLVIIPLSIIIIVHRSLHRFVAMDSREWALSEDMRPALYLRSWEADEIRVPAPALRRGAVEHFAPPRRMSFAELIGESAERQAPVLAVGQPNTSRLAGVGSMWLPDDTWQRAVRAQAADALCVVMTASVVPAESGYEWELDLVGSGRTTSRLVLVFPPGLTVTQSWAPGGFLAVASQLPAFRGLSMMDLDDETIVVARSGKSPWKAYAARVRTDGAYCMCITQALDHFGSEWDKELDAIRPRSVHPSVERFVRDAGMLGYREAFAARWVARGVLLFEKLRGTRNADDA